MIVAPLIVVPLAPKLTTTDHTSVVGGVSIVGCGSTGFSVVTVTGGGVTGVPLIPFDRALVPTIVY